MSVSLKNAALLAGCVVVVVVVAAKSASAALIPTVVYNQKFDTDTPDLATTLTVYPELSGLGNVKVAGNAAEIINSGGNELLTDQTYNEEIWMSARMGMFGGSPGTAAHGMVIGNRAILYFGGNGAFRIYEFNNITGVQGPQLSSPTNISMSYTPAFNQYQRMTVHSDNLGGLDVTITDTLNPLNTWSQSFNFGGFVPGPVGFATFFGGITARFDNWSIIALREEPLVVIPEPTTLGLLLLGLTGMFATRRSRAGR